jgi:uracil-DNA glycosylase
MPDVRRSATTQALLQLHEQIKRCTRCPLHRSRTQAVPGVGPSSAGIVLVGEAPGRQEDRQGEPFVGAAGKVLDELLASVGLSRAEVYITNVVKSRPTAGPRPGRNRPPAPSEIAACRPWLDEQLRIIRPAVIVTLGRIALDQFAPGRSLAEVHGRLITHEGVTILPLYHPATILYRRTWMRVLKRDIQQLRRVLAKSRRAPKTAR